MKSRLLVLLAGLLLLGFAAPARQAQAAVSVGVSVVTGGPHRGLSLSFSSRPEFVVIPGSRVYYGRDIDRDVYCYGDEWYYVDDGAWYEGPSYRGPFVQVTFSSVPYEIRGIPVRYRRHWSDPWSSNRTTYRDYGSGSYGNNRGGYSDRTWNQNNNQQREWNQNDPRDRGSWNRNDNGRQNNNGNGHGRKRGQNREDHRGHDRGNWNQ